MPGCAIAYPFKIVIARSDGKFRNDISCVGELGNCPFESEYCPTAFLTISANFSMARAPAHFGANDVGGEISSGGMEPTGEDRAVSHLQRIFCERDKGGLGDILRGMGVGNHAESGGIDEIDMTPHQFSECRLGLPLGVIAQKLLVAQFVNSRDSNRRGEFRTALRRRFIGALF